MAIAAGGIGAVPRAVRADPSTVRSRGGPCGRCACVPYLVGAAMFAVAVWVLHSTLRRYDLADLHAELAELTALPARPRRPVHLPELPGSGRLRVVGAGHGRQAAAAAQLALASFATQSIAHSTGFAFVVGATLRYNFYADRGLGIADVAKVQMFFTATFTLGVATLAGGVVMIEPWRLAAATGLPPWLWRAGGRQRRSPWSSPTSSGAASSTARCAGAGASSSCPAPAPR